MIEEEIQIGDIVKTIPFYKKEKPRTGVVRQIKYHRTNNPIEEHGFVEVLFGNGDVEHFSHYQWERSLKIIEKR